MELFEENGNIIHIQREISKTLYPFLNTRDQWKTENLAKQYKYTLISLQLMDYLANHKRLFISTLGVIKFNERLDQLMVEDLMNRLDLSISNKKRHDETFLQFMAECSIDEDDIRFDSLKKRCYRERVKLKEKIFLGNNLSRTYGVLDLSFTEKLVQS